MSSYSISTAVSGSDLRYLFEMIGLDTHRYRIEYLAEQMGVSSLLNESSGEVMYVLNEFNLRQFIDGVKKKFGDGAGERAQLVEVHFPDTGGRVVLDLSSPRSLREAMLNEKRLIQTMVDAISRAFENSKWGRKMNDHYENVVIPRKLEKLMRDNKHVRDQGSGIFRHYHASPQSRPINLVPMTPPEGSWQSWRSGYKTAPSAEQRGIPRVCVANDPEMCAKAMGSGPSNNEYIYIHEPDDPSEIDPETDVTPTSEVVRHVPNAAASGEYWIRKPYRSFPIGHYEKSPLEKFLQSMPLSYRSKGPDMSSAADHVFVRYTPEYYDKQMNKMTKKNKDFPNSYEGLLNRYGRLRALKKSGQQVDGGELSDLRAKILSMEQQGKPGGEAAASGGAGEPAAPGTEKLPGSAQAGQEGGTPRDEGRGTVKESVLYRIIF
jgi:hypothetical protein